MYVSHVFYKNEKKHAFMLFIRKVMF